MVKDILPVGAALWAGWMAAQRLSEAFPVSSPSAPGYEQVQGPLILVFGVPTAAAIAYFVVRTVVGAGRN